jgi:hypothetical protein
MLGQTGATAPAGACRRLLNELKRFSIFPGRLVKLLGGHEGHKTIQTMAVGILGSLLALSTCDLGLLANIASRALGLVH